MLANFAHWYTGKSFTSDWTSKHFALWADLLAGFRDHPVRVLEIGSWEGRSALFFLNYLPKSTIVCIDTFSGGEDMQHAAPDALDAIPDCERRFIDNLLPFGARVEVRKMRSVEALPQLAIEGRQFDLAYIDGSHMAADVYADAMLTWPLIRLGGLVIFDDYEWKHHPKPEGRPKPGINCALAKLRGTFETVHCGYQIAIRKRA